MLSRQTTIYFLVSELIDMMTDTLKSKISDTYLNLVDKRQINHIIRLKKYLERL